MTLQDDGLPVLRALDAARANPLVTDWDNLPIPVPWFVGRRLIEPTLEDLVPFIDRTSRLAESDPKAVLDRLVGNKLLRPRGVYGFWPANTDANADDIVVYKDDARATQLVRFHMLRQQESFAAAGPNCSLADFIAPRDSFAPDYIGAFALTVGGAVDDHGATIARAFAEYLHKQAREDWGLDATRGIRTTFGDSACPDPSENAALFRLLHAEEIGMSLNESFAIVPAASVGGLYFAHPEARPFHLGRIDRDQIADYARRKNVPADQVARLLGTTPND